MNQSTSDTACGLPADSTGLVGPNVQTAGDPLEALEEPLRPKRRAGAKWLAPIYATYCRQIFLAQSFSVSDRSQFVTPSRLASASHDCATNSFSGSISLRRQQ